MTKAHGALLAAQKERDRLRQQNERLLGALKLAHRIAHSWIHDQLDGTSHLQDSLQELEPARAAIQEAEG